MRNLLFISIISVFFSSCATNEYFYQLYKIQSEDITKNDDKNIVYEGKHLEIISDFWDDGGNSTFMIYNKTDSNVYLDLGESHFIVNGIAQTYFQNRAFTKVTSIRFSNSYTKSLANKYIYSSGSGIVKDYTDFPYYRTMNSAQEYFNDYPGDPSRYVVASNGNSIIYNELRIICIPPQSGKVVEGFIIKAIPYRDCNLVRFPPEKQYSTEAFTIETTPLNFRHFLTYSFYEDLKDVTTIDLTYWVSEITNYKNESFFSGDYIKNCGQKSLEMRSFYKFENPQYFFIKYQDTYNEFQSH